MFCVLKKKISEDELYKAMESNIIPPPKDRWSNQNRKKKDRLKLEYVHATKYLGLLEVSHGFVIPDFSKNIAEKEEVLRENSTRCFEPNAASPPFTPKERTALLKIVFEYERARDFLRWFLDFEMYPTIWSFNENDFRNNGKPIYIASKIEPRKKAREYLRRENDAEIWRIPDERPDDYTRLVSFILPNWFKELCLIDRIVVFPEFSFDGNTWYMYYPIKSNPVLTLEKLQEEIFNLFEKGENTKAIWIPFLLFVIAKKFNCSTDIIKNMLLKLNELDFSRYILERSSLQVMKYADKIHYSSYGDSFIETDGFFRSYLVASKIEKR